MLRTDETLAIVRGNDEAAGAGAALLRRRRQVGVPGRRVAKGRPHLGARRMGFPAGRGVGLVPARQRRELLVAAGGGWGGGEGGAAAGRSGRHQRCAEVPQP